MSAGPTLKNTSYIIVFVIILSFLFIEETFACSDRGYTIATINGVLNDERSARQNMNDLRDAFANKTWRGQLLEFNYLLNPSHLGGIGDLAKVAYQKYFEDETVLDYDLLEMLKTMSEKVTTRKILLVAHSQGNFYANSIYDSVVDAIRPDRSVGTIFPISDRVPAESIAVYAVATPAGRVAGGGKWLTSDTDKVIAEAVPNLSKKKIMPPNTHIELGPGDDKLGHGFSDIYLKYRGAEIVSDIQLALDSLRTDTKEVAAGASTKAEPCIPLPRLGLTHRLKGKMFAVSDPIASAAVSGTAAAISTSRRMAVRVADGFYEVGKLAAQSVGNALAAVGVALNIGGGSQTSQLDRQAVSLQEPEQIVSIQQRGSTAIPDSAFVESRVESREVETIISLPVSKAAKSVSEVQDVDSGVLDAAIQPSPPAGGAGSPQEDSSASQIRSLRGDVSDTLLYVATPIADSVPISSNGPGIQFVAPAQSLSSGAATSSPQATSTPEVLPEPTPPDIIPPDISLSVSECLGSLSPNSCLVATTTIHALWFSNATDTAYFILDKNNTVATTTATSTAAILTNDSSYTISVSAVDTSGNKSATSSQAVFVSQTPVVINELAWGGTAANSDDEWIELYNRSSQDINLTNFVLYSKTDLNPYIDLSGVITAGGYFLIEAKNTGETDEATQGSVKNIAADLWTSFGSRLNNNGENIVLSLTPATAGQASTTIDEIPFCNNWCGVSSSRTTERYDPDSSGNSNTNWASNNGIIINGLNVSGGIIIGTPKARNSINYLINRGADLSSDLTLVKKNSPYLINDATQTIKKDTTLTIEPGVVIKFRNAARLSADGNIMASGTASDPIVFTAFADDTYGGDTDGAVVAPTKGSWFGVELSKKSTGSSFANTIFRYGGDYGTGASYKKAMLYATEVSPSITDSIFEYSRAYGLYLDKSGSVVSNNIFRGNASTSFSAGLFVNQGSPAISGNSFSQNDLGIDISSSQGLVSNNSFSLNTKAMNVTGPSVPIMTGNSGGANDAIHLFGNITGSGATSTLYANPVPYFLSGTVTVVAGSVMDILEGTVIKNTINGAASTLFVFGRLNIDTSTTTGVIFSNNLATSTRGTWSGIVMKSGSSSKIKGATIRDTVTGIKYTNSPIYLEDVTFSTNTTGVQVLSGASVEKATNVIFINNGTDKSPSSLW